MMRICLKAETRRAYWSESRDVMDVDNGVRLKTKMTVRKSVVDKLEKMTQPFCLVFRFS